MAKRSKQYLAELDAAIDQLGGGAAPIARPSRRRKASEVSTQRRTRKKAVATRRKKKAVATRRKK